MDDPVGVLLGGFLIHFKKQQNIFEEESVGSDHLVERFLKGHNRWGPMLSFFSCQAFPEKNLGEAC